MNLFGKYGLLTKREVKMAGYWPSSFFCVFMDLVETEHAWSIKDFVNGIKRENINKFFLSGQSPYPEQAGWSSLARSGYGLLPITARDSARLARSWS